MRTLWPLLLLVGAALLPGIASAETGLAQVCTVTSAANKWAGDCKAPTGTTWGKYARPGPDDLVSDCGIAVGGVFAIRWTATTPVTRPFKDVAADHCVVTCATDIPANTLVPNPWTIATDRCRVWTATPKPQVVLSGVPGEPVLTGGAVLTWTAPTKNEDGSALTNLAGFKIYHAAPGQGFTLRATIINPMARTYDATGLPVGVNRFVITAFSTAGESKLSNEASKIVTDTTPVPINCVVSDPSWTLGTPTPATCPSTGQQSRTDTRLLSIIVQPANGGTACPVLNQTKVVPVTCTPPVTNPCVAQPLTEIKNVTRYVIDSKVPNVTLYDARGCTATVTR